MESESSQRPKLVRPGDLRAFLGRAGHLPVHARGQNFLVDGNILEKIVGAARLSTRDTVLEIGAGAGALTQGLVAHAGRVVAVEIDRRLGEMLREFFREQGNLKIVIGDALRLPWTDLVLPAETKVVANLPYYLTTPLWTRLVEAGFPLLVLMVQKEVAERAVAPSGSQAYGAFTVFLDYHGRTELVAKVPPAAFYPRPEVTSWIVRFTRHPAPPVAADAALLEKVVRAAFRYRRKTLRRALAQGLGLAAESLGSRLVASGLDPERRGETLSLEEFAAVSRVVGGEQANCPLSSVPRGEN